MTYVCLQSAIKHLSQYYTSSKLRHSGLQISVWKKPNHVTRFLLYEQQWCLIDTLGTHAQLAGDKNGQNDDSNDSHQAYTDACTLMNTFDDAVSANGEKKLGIRV